MKNTKKVFLIFLMVFGFLALNAGIADAAITSGLPASIGNSSSPTIFNMNGNWYLIAGEGTGDPTAFFGFQRIAGVWVPSASITAGLPVTDSVRPTVFQIGATWYLLCGGCDAFGYGYERSGAVWIPSTIDTGLFLNHSMTDPTVFPKDGGFTFADGNRHCIVGRHGGDFFGYTWGGPWAASDIEEVMPDPIFNDPKTLRSTNLTVFKMGATWYAITGEWDGQFDGFEWNLGLNKWTSSLIENGLPKIGDYLATTPEVFEIDGVWYLIFGETGGGLFGYHWDPVQLKWIYEFNDNFPPIITSIAAKKNGGGNIPDGGIACSPDDNPVTIKVDATDSTGIDKIIIHWGVNGLWNSHTCNNVGSCTTPFIAIAVGDHIDYYAEVFDSAVPQNRVDTLPNRSFDVIVCCVPNGCGGVPACPPGCDGFDDPDCSPGCLDCTCDTDIDCPGHCGADFYCCVPCAADPDCCSIFCPTVPGCRPALVPNSHSPAGSECCGQVCVACNTGYAWDVPTSSCLPLCSWQNDGCGLYGCIGQMGQSCHPPGCIGGVGCNPAIPETNCVADPSCVENCNDVLINDEDGNGFANCADTDNCSECDPCDGIAGNVCMGGACIPKLVSEAGFCADTLNNDCQNGIDCADSDCASDPNCCLPNCSSYGAQDPIVVCCSHHGQNGICCAAGTCCAIDSQCPADACSICALTDHYCNSSTCSCDTHNELCPAGTHCSGNSCQDAIEICGNSADEDCDNIDLPCCFWDDGGCGAFGCDYVTERGEQCLPNPCTGGVGCIGGTINCIPEEICRTFGLPDRTMLEILLDVADWLLNIIIALAFLMIVIGGVMYISSTGNPERTELAKKTIVYAIIGLIIAGASYAAVRALFSMLE